MSGPAASGGDGAAIRCPFLEEAPARYCHAAPRRQIPSAVISAADDRCSSTRYVECPVARGTLGAAGSASSCPHLGEMLVQYCTAAPVVKFIPYNDSVISRCNSEAYRSCPLHVQRAHPVRSPGGGPGDHVASPDLPFLPVLEGLAYATNHMWLDLAADGSCKVGLDAFAAHVLGPPDEVRFLTWTGLGCPALGIRVRQVDLTMVFPRRIVVNGCNAHLRQDPAPIHEDPYGRGWLFEGFYVDKLAGDAVLLRDSSAAEWMRGEVDRMQRFVHDGVRHALPGGEPTAMDGGIFAPGLARQLDADSLLRLHRDFLSPGRMWRPS